MDTIERDMRLQEGAVFGEYWFNEKSFHTFMTLVTFAQVNNVPGIQWPNAKREWVNIPTAEAVPLCVEVMQSFQKLYAGDAG